jgi:hypothetical protein
MSGFEVLLNFASITFRPEVAVIVLTRLNHLSLPELAKLFGAQAALLKTRTSSECLDQAILESISTVQMERNRAKPATLPTTRLDLKRPA